MIKAPEYDSIASTYSANPEKRDDRATILVPSAKFYLGDLTGKRVLDPACGDGYFTRLLKTWGAAEVVGVDFSKEMIDIARKIEREQA